MKNTILKLNKSKDGEGRESLTIQIADKGVFIPVSIITDFLNSESKSVKVIIPE
jgi:hypothetical protein